MKPNVHRGLVTGLLFAFLYVVSPAVVSGEESVTLRLGQNERWRFVGSNCPAPSSANHATPAISPEEQAMTYLTAHAADFGLLSGLTLQHVKTKHCVRGDAVSVRFGVYYLGVPVVGGDACVTVFPDGSVSSALVNVPDVSSLKSVVPRLKAGNAGEKLSGAEQFEPRLVVVPRGHFGLQAEARLAWLFDFLPGNQDHPNEMAVVDADTGAVLCQLSLEEEDEAGLAYDANWDSVWFSGGVPQCPGTLERDDATPCGDPVVDRAYETLEDVVAFYGERGQDNYGDNGQPVPLRVKFCSASDTNCGSNLCSSYSSNWDGYYINIAWGNEYADDCIGHEFTHAVNRMSGPNFARTGEPTALNEGFPYTIGELIDLLNDKERAFDDTITTGFGRKWWYGEDRWTRAAAYADDQMAVFPPPDGIYPNGGAQRWFGGGYTLGHPGIGRYSQYDPAADAHSNGMILAKFLYLLVEGTLLEDPSNPEHTDVTESGHFNGYCFSGIDADPIDALELAADLFVECLTNRLISTSDFEDVYLTIRQVALDFGCTARQIKAIDLAGAATEINHNPPEPHDADLDENWQISSTEINRVITFYSAGTYHVDAGTVDGYAPGSGSQVGDPHDSDYAPANWIISAVELSRLVTFYNTGGYHVDASTADGFAPD